MKLGNADARGPGWPVVNRRVIARVSIVLTAGTMALLPGVMDSIRAGQPAGVNAGEVVLSSADTLAGWSKGAVLSDDRKEGLHSVAWEPTPAGTAAALNFSLGDKRDAVAHAQTLTFWYKFEGKGVTTFHIKAIAYPLAGGWQAIYPLPVPNSNQWRRAHLAVQQFEDQWGDKPQTEGGVLQFRVMTASNANARLLVDDVRVTPLPAGVPVNLGRKGQAMKPLVSRNQPLNLPAHPRLLFSSSDIPAMKERMARTEWGKAYFAGLKKRGNDWLTAKVELPPRGGQWWHWYACSKDGAHLKTESPNRHVCPICGKVYSGQPYDDVVFGPQHSKLAEGVRDLGLLYRLENDKRCAAKAREILLAYAEKYLSYPLHNPGNEPKEGGGRVSSQVLEDSIWLIPMAQGADAIWDTLSPADIETLRTKLFYPAVVDVIQKSRLGIHNIRCWMNSAVGLTGLLFGDPVLVSDAIDGETGYQAQMARGVTEDGSWYEGAWSYHFYTMDGVRPLTEAAFRCGIDLYGPAYRKMFLAPLDFAMPGGSLPVFNDCMPATVMGNANYEIALARYKDDRLALPLATSNRRTVQAFVNGVLTLPAARAGPQVGRNFPNSGYAILRAGVDADATWLCVKYGPHGGGHGHPDKNTFVLHAAGRVVAADAGTGKYGIPLQAGWYTTTLAHNTLIMDETSQWPATGSCLDFQTSDGWSAALTDAGYAYAEIAFRRAAFLIGRNLVVFLDLVKAEDGSAHTFDFACHLPGVWSRAFSGDSMAAPQKPGYSYLQDLKSRSVATGLVFTVASTGTTASAAVVFGPSPGGPTTYLTGTGVGVNTQDRVPVVIARRRAPATVLMWAIVPNAGTDIPGMEPVPVSGENGAAIPEGEAAAALVKTSDAAWLVVANPAGRAIRAGGWSGSGKLAVAKK